ncbi:hypothetical protein [Microbacterium esteraromaticum]|uniref:hypothetical protein n=1 Tax=Microbacterium esteraromaticum TaxID=57043 RepID=UPI0019D3D40E|nr:hypothetical protein [Microbacterium esteraromaticum]MBN7792425.1 hypothetical protein [Microbacterium esteraromaticum]
MAAKKATAYKVVGAAAVIRKDNGERYLYRGAVFSADVIDDDNAKHLLSAKLIEPFEAVEDSAAEAEAKAKAEGK